MQITPAIGSFYMYAEFLKVQEKVIVFTSESILSLCYEKPLDDFADHLVTESVILEKCIAEIPVEAA